ncbi:MAG: NAD-dependent epimerase/dehydratase family protein [Acidimicrobiales bacterium]
MVPWLLSGGDEVLVLDRVPFPAPGIATVVGDICDAAVLDDAFSGPVDAVVHLAARPSVLESMRFPNETFETNVVGTQRILERCRAHGVGRFVLASTNAVVGDVGSEVISEDRALRPLTPYGASKAAAEMLVGAYGSSYGTTCMSLRFTNVYGPGMATKDSVVARLLKASLTRSAVQVYGDGTQVRDYLYVDDALEAVGLALLSDKPGAYVIGSGEVVSVNDLLRVAAEVTGVDLPVDRVAAKPGEMPAVIVDIARARQLGFVPKVMVREGMQATWSNFAGMDPVGT